MQINNFMIVENMEDLSLLFACHNNTIAIGENAIHETHVLYTVFYPQEKKTA